MGDAEAAFNSNCNNDGKSHRTMSFTNGGFQLQEPNLPHSPLQCHQFGQTGPHCVQDDSRRTKEKSSELKERRRILWNISMISIAFMFLFTAFQSMSNLQSSINSEAGLGTASLATIYAALIVSCLFVPTIAIKRLSCKWAMFLSMFCYIAYIAAQFSPSFYTIIPAAVILGFGAAPLWSAKCTYLTQIGNRYATLVGEKSEVIVVKFFGIFFMTFQTSQIWGNIISSTVLSSGVERSSNFTVSDEILSTCGACFCGASDSNSSVENTNLEKPPIGKIYTMASIYLASALIATAIIALAVDSLSKYGEGETADERLGLSSDSKSNGIHLLNATFRQMKSPFQQLLIPLTIFSGLEQGFLSADFTQGFISCALGIHNVGYVMIAYGVSDAIGSISFGPVIRYTGRTPIFILGAALNAAMIVLMLLWKPDPNQLIVFYLIAVIWGIVDAIWQTQINAFYGVVFANNEEAAFSNYRLWESLGFILAYSYSSLLCVRSKLYILAIVLSAGMIGFLAVEMMIKKQEKQNKQKQQKQLK